MNITLLAPLALLLALFALGALFVTDLKTRLLPNKYVLLFFLSGLLFHIACAFHFIAPLNMFYGAGIGAGILYAIKWGAEKFYGPDALGLGDVKLMGAAGIWLGPYNILLALSLGAMAGIVHGVGIVFWNKFRHDKTLSFATLTLPAGPGFIFGIIMIALFEFWTLPSLIFS